MIAQFRNLLKRQLNGDPDIADALEALTVGFESSPALCVLQREWSAMFSFAPGRKEGLPLLLRLTDWLGEHPEAKLADLYACDGWKQLVALRGPVDVVIERICADCNHSTPAMRITPGRPLRAMICRECGNVYFKAERDKRPVPSCDCGAPFFAQHKICRKCGGKRLSIQREYSPYEYFANHSFQLGSGRP